MNFNSDISIKYYRLKGFSRRNPDIFTGFSVVFTGKKSRNGYFNKNIWNRSRRFRSQYQRNHVVCEVDFDRFADSSVCEKSRSDLRPEGAGVLRHPRRCGRDRLQCAVVYREAVSRAADRQYRGRRRRGEQSLRRWFGDDCAFRGAHGGTSGRRPPPVRSRTHGVCCGARGCGHHHCGGARLLQEFGRADLRTGGGDALGAALCACGLFDPRETLDVLLLPDARKADRLPGAAGDGVRQPERYSDDLGGADLPLYKYVDEFPR